MADPSHVVSHICTKMRGHVFREFQDTVAMYLRLSQAEENMKRAE
jgi:hypothetical protein